MLKKITKLIVLVITLFLFNNVYAKEYIKVNENNNNTYSINDEIDILSEDDVLKIQDQMNSLTQYGNVSIRIVSKEVEREELESTVNETFNNWKKDGNYLMVYINVKNDMDPKIFNNIFIKNYGFNISDEDLMNVVWKVTPTLRNGKVNDTIHQTFDNLNGLSAGEKEGVYTPGSTKTSNYKIIIEDDANLLSEEEKVKLMDDMSPMAEYGNIIFKSIDNNPYYDTAEFAKNFYRNTYGKANGTVLLIDMDNRIVYIFSEGDNYDIITRSKSEIITDNIYRYLGDQKYYDGAKEAYLEMYQIMNGYKIAEPMRYASNVVISLVVAFLINFIMIMITCSTRKSNQSEVAKGLEMAVAINSFQALSNGTHKVYSPVTTDSGGGSSGGFSSSGGHSGGGFSGGGGGGFHGGGGGHRF